jgi:threonine dehydratase
VTPAAALRAAAQVTPERIDRTAGLLSGRVRRTPVLTIDRAEFGLPPGPLVLKLEQLQHTGSFKARGAFANLLLAAAPPAGVAAASGGNHGAAVAYAAQQLGVPARIFVPEVSAPAKVARIRAYGADLVITGSTYADAFGASEDWAAASGARQVHAFDHPHTMLGAGTLALELQQQTPAVDVVLAGVGGGGLLAGIAGAYAGTSQIIGAEPDTAPTLTRALLAGRPVDAPAGGIAVDSLAPRRVGEATFAVLSGHGAQTVLVSDEDIRHAQRLLWDTLRLVIEPGGCAALAALTSRRWNPSPGQSVAVILSGANTHPATVGAGDLATAGGPDL